ncbi:MAG: hypothetical protein ACUVRR_13145, partial [Candidatus Fervidibacter sp.]|uniref:hypothetical protein n=1 Tax=Candidatus Fervidibacter sp. TaxID=3100871 RepID=UPI0040496EDC
EVLVDGAEDGAVLVDGAELVADGEAEQLVPEGELVEALAVVDGDATKLKRKPKSAEKDENVGGLSCTEEANFGGCCVG